MMVVFFEVCKVQVQVLHSEKVLFVPSLSLPVTVIAKESTKSWNLYAEAWERTPSPVTSTWAILEPKTTKFIKELVCPKLVWGQTVTDHQRKELIVLRSAIVLALKRTHGSALRSTTTVGLVTKLVDTVSNMTLKLLYCLG